MTQTLQLHASAFAYAGIGCVLLGPSGSGKSATMAQALLHGGRLIADDQVVLRSEAGALTARAPKEIAGVFELRGLGIVRVAPVEAHALHLAVELTSEPVERLPAPETCEFLCIELPLLRLPAMPHTPVAALLLYLQAMQEGRILPPDWHPATAAR